MVLQNPPITYTHPVLPKIQIFYPSAHFSGWFRLKGKSRKTFNIIESINCVFLNFDFGEELKPGSLPLHPPQVRHWHSAWVNNRIVKEDSIPQQSTVCGIISHFNFNKQSLFRISTSTSNHYFAFQLQQAITITHFNFNKQSLFRILTSTSNQYFAF